MAVELVDEDEEEVTLYFVDDRCGGDFAALYFTEGLPGETEIRDFLHNTQLVARAGHGTLIARGDSGWSIEGGGMLSNFPEAEILVTVPLPPSPARGG